MCAALAGAAPDNMMLGNDGGSTDVQQHKPIVLFWRSILPMPSGSAAAMVATPLSWICWHFKSGEEKTHRPCGVSLLAGIGS